MWESERFSRIGDELLIGEVVVDPMRPNPWVSPDPDQPSLRNENPTQAVTRHQTHSNLATFPRFDVSRISGGTAKKLGCQ